MHSVFSLQSLIDLVKGGISGYGVFATLWGMVLYVAYRVKDNEFRNKRDKDANTARGELEKINKDRDEAQAQSDRYRHNVTLELERKNRALAVIARELRHLLDSSMQRNDGQDKWIAIVEVPIKKTDPQLMEQKPKLVAAPTLADVLAIYMEHSASESEGEDGT